MSDWPKISIVTPSFNQGRYIEETIQSVLFQNYPNLEYIIIDGGSTDETISVIKKYEGYITYWVSEPDNGQSEAINKGLKYCTGEIFNWLNSDDSYLPDTFFNVATAFMQDTGLIAVSGFEKHLLQNGEIKLVYGTKCMATLEETIERCEVAQPSTFFRLKDVQAIGLLNELHNIMDGDLWINILLRYGQGKFKKLNKPLVNFRIHPESKTSRQLQGSHFLIERSSIICNLQQYIGLPAQIIQYYISQVYRSPQIIPLKKKWEINEIITSKRKLRIYFIKKYIIYQFINKNQSEVLFGMKQLVRNKSINFFFVKGIVKLVLMKIKND